MNWFYAPGDWLGNRFNARGRRALAAWVLILVIIQWPISYIWKDQVWFIWVISEVALVLGLWGVVSAETPVESETVNDTEE